MPPCTTKRRRTTNLKTKNNQNCQKIELYGSPTTKELKKKHSTRPVGGVDINSQGGEDVLQGSRWRTGRARQQLVVPYLCADKPGGTTGEQDRPCHPGLKHREIASNLSLKTPVDVEAAAGETPSLTGEFVGETHRGLECTQTHPLGNQHQKGPI